MFTKFLRSLIAFGAVFVAYQAYALLVPPLLEPPGVTRSTATVAEEEWERGSDAVRRYQKLLAHYLPTGHWALTGPIKVLESGPMLLAFDDWDRDDRGGVRLSKLVTIMFPTPREDASSRGSGGIVAPRDAVVLEAPGDPAVGFAAELQFDAGFDPTRGQVGKITGGRFPGPITIRSDGAKPGVEDDLWLETRDLRLDGPLLFTPHDVRVRHGMSRGGGRRLEIKLIEEPGGAPGDGLKIAGVESIEVFEQVKLELHGRRLSLTGDQSAGEGPAGRRVTQRDAAVRPTQHVSPTPAGPNASDVDIWLDAAKPAPVASTPTLAAPRRVPAVAPVKPSAPVEVTCAGSLRIDLLRFVASFTDRVLARQVNYEGASDQLTCERLDVHFADGSQSEIDPTADPDFTRNQRRAAKDLRPRRLVAYGQPVKLDAPARGAMARGRRLDVEIETRRITLAGDGSFLRHAAGEVHAPLIRYEHPPKTSNAPIGRLWVGGPGWLSMASKRDPHREPMTARWQEAPGVEFPVQLLARDRGPALVVLGRPEIEAPGLGKLTAERIEATLLEVPADGPNGPAIEVGKHAVALMPEQINASGGVTIDSPELLGRTEELTAWIRPGEPAASGATASSGGVLQRGPSGGQSAPKDRYELTARRMEIDVAMAARRAAPQRLVCAGGARFLQQPKQRGDEPLVVTGDRIKVDRLDTKQVRVDVIGGGQEPAALATIQARGVRLTAADVHLDQQTNRLWADGAGEAHLRTDRDLLGQQTTATTDLHLRWRGGFDFDGQHVTVRKDVFGEGPHDWVRTNKLVATLSQRINFAAGGIDRRGRGGKPVVEIARVACSEGVEIDHRSVDERGQRSHEKAQLQTLVYEHRTGALSGQGPGWVRSVHLSKGGGLGIGGDKQNRVPQAAPAQEKLRFLRVHFLQGVTGNLNTRVLAFHQRVRAVYGPVLAWQHEIPLDPPGGLPPDTAMLASDHLQVNEDPLQRGHGSQVGPVELRATGSVHLETARRGGGVFTAQASAASYAQAKELFTIEGVPGNYARIWIQDKPGRPPKVQSARKFSYWRNTNQLKFEDFGGFDSAPGQGPPLRNATRPRR